MPILNMVYWATWGWGWRLPAGFQEVEYITSSGTQWINTNVSPSNTLSFEFAITPSGSNQSENAILWDEWSANAIFFMFYSNKYRFHNWWAAGVSVDWPTAQTGVKTSIVLDNTGMTIDGILYPLTAGNSYENNYKVALFWTWWGYQTNRRWAFSLRETVIKDNWTAVRDFVPCYRIADSVIGLYDLVNDVFYTNSGSGTFTKWNDVN